MGLNADPTGRIPRRLFPVEPDVHVHAHFLRELGERLQARRDVFRVLLGPGYPGHKNHVHFDCAKYRMVEGFE